jgi:phosphoribosylanthranilate isomerase
MISVKICGLTSESVVQMSIEAGADRVGFVLVEASPRFVAFDRAQALIRQATEARAEAWVVATADIPWLDRIVDETPEIGAVQLHGAETPEDIAAFARRHPLVPVVKALGVATRSDLARAETYEAADAFLFDALPPRGADRQGGFGRSFDWSILKGFSVHGHEDWVLSGGLTPDNVAEAIQASGAVQLDVSSGVEGAPGVKDPAKVRAFIQAAKRAG